LGELCKALGFGRYKATLVGIGFGLACLLGLVIRSETANGWFWNCALHFARMARPADNFVYLRVLWGSITYEMMTEL
jgi:hypothetical protein